MLSVVFANSATRDVATHVDKTSKSTWLPSLNISGDCPQRPKKEVSIVLFRELSYSGYASGALPFSCSQSKSAAILMRARAMLLSAQP